MTCQGGKRVLGSAMAVADRVVQQGIDVRSVAVATGERIRQNLADVGVRVNPTRSRLSSIDATLRGARAHVCGKHFRRRDRDRRRSGHRSRTMAHRMAFRAVEELRDRLVPAVVLPCKTVRPSTIGQRGQMRRRHLVTARNHMVRLQAGASR